MKLIVHALALAVLLGCSGLAHAQATRTWVSGVGDDVNPCSRTAPCKTFAGAISKTAASGEINCLDSGGFGTVTITKSIAIICEGVVAGVLATGTTGVIVNDSGSGTPGTIVVYLSGLDIQGAGMGINGVRFLSGGALHINKTNIRGFGTAAPNGNGILVDASTGTKELFVNDSVLADNGVVGIELRPTGSGSVTAAITNVRSENNGTGFRANGSSTTGNINMSLDTSVASGNSAAGISAAAGTSPSVQVMVARTSTVENGTFGLRVDGAAATLRFGSTVVTGNGTGTSSANSGVLGSYGNNQINGNTVDGAAPPVIPLQ